LNTASPPKRPRVAGIAKQQGSAVIFPRPGALKLQREKSVPAASENFHKYRWFGGGYEEDYRAAGRPQRAKTLKYSGSWQDERKNEP